MLVPKKARQAYEGADRALTQGNFLAAQKDLDRALFNYPNSAVARCLMGALYEEQLQLDRAFAEYSEALRVDSKMLPAYLGLARIAFREQRWQEVAGRTNQLVTINPIAFPAAHLYNAVANFNIGDFAAAEKSARRYESLDPQHERPQVYLLLGDILAREQDFVGAVQQKRIFLMIVPAAPNAKEIRKEIRGLERLSGSARK